MAKDDMVWVDDGMGPIVAAYASGPYDSTHWIREPKQVPKDKVDLSYMRVLDEKTLKTYRDCIQKVKDRKKSLKK